MQYMGFLSSKVREAYRVFDKERTGHIAASELRMIFAALPERLSEMEIEEMLRAADRDGN
jgi:calmodulin